MEGKLAQTTPAHILAANPTIRKDVVEGSPTSKLPFEEAAGIAFPNTSNQDTQSTEPADSLPLHETGIQISCKVTEGGTIHPGSQLWSFEET